MISAHTFLNARKSPGGHAKTVTSPFLKRIKFHLARKCRWKRWTV